MAQKITGAQIEFDSNAPLIDVDTAIEDLAEDLSRAGRIRQLHALRHLTIIARQVQFLPGFEVQDEEASRVIRSVNLTTGVIVLEPLSDHGEKEDDA